MTPPQVQKLRDELCGMVADAGASHRTGGELALFLRGKFARIDAILKELTDPPTPQPVANGKPAAPAAPPQQQRR